MSTDTPDHGLCTRLLNYAEKVADLAKPEAVIDRLHTAIGGVHRLSVLGAGRLPLKFGDWDAVKLGETVFLHGSVPAGWWGEYIIHARRGFDAGIMMARISLAPYTWSEQIRMLQPVGIERWPSELALKYGMRDGLTCPVGARWVVAFWSSKLLARELQAGARAALFMAASVAAVRLEALVGPNPRRLGKGAALTPRELSVLRGASFGKPIQEIAETLGLGEETVRSHFKKAQDKLGARNRAHAVAEAMRLHLFP